MNNADEAAVGFKIVNENDTSVYMSICDNVEVLSGREALDQAMDPVKPWVGYAWGKLVKSSIIKGNHVAFDTTISICEDSLFNYNVLLYIKKVVKIADAKYNYFIRLDSATRTAAADCKKLKTKVIAFEKAAEIAESMKGRQFYSRINNTLFNSIVSYLTAMFVNREYDKKEINLMMGKLKVISKKINYRALPKGIRFRYIVLKISPRILYVIQKK
mgnify:CR=1 FL=1